MTSVKDSALPASEPTRPVPDFPVFVFRDPFRLRYSDRIVQIEPGTSLAHYEITAPLGKGGMGPRFLPDGSGIVYETFDVRAKVDLATIGLEEGATPRVFLESMLAVRSIAPANTGVVVVENWRSELD